MIKLNKRERETLREINMWVEFPEYWKPKTRAKLESMNFVANVAPAGCVANYQLTEKGKVLLSELVLTGVFD